MQGLLVGLIVGVCALHAGWHLLPARARAPLARWLLAWPVLGRAWAALPAVAQAARGVRGGCACDGCPASGRVAPPASSGARGAGAVEQPLRWQPRPPRG